ncbi:ABC transporter permease [Alkaliphilus peptidifermentans]|uniref:Oligopeptide transport system permease protein n=1 Tax=Alkaliphilus peptidifermentans DSM 18978 TaxID=1120976 RepID=A0A1G5AYG6_9FIRM|nr:ABC transporter permease [Alkaliphilus peptidifermentans]SCX82870.1 oligopeptide transport system permease protein [Alkaliphilus peptidifermentans DSM 18978]
METAFRPVAVENKEKEVIARESVSYWKDAWRRLKTNKVAIVAIFILATIVIMTIIGPSISGHDYKEINSSMINQRPSVEHWFGTDALGRDIFSRVWQGGRISMIIGLTGALIATVVGSIYGSIAAYFGGRVDTIMMRIVEILISLPYLILVILISIILDSRSIGTMLLALTLAGWCGIARLVRGQMLQLKQQEFIMAAEALGVKPWKIIVKHLIPNCLGIIIVAISFDVPGYIFAEAFLSYIGLGIQPPGTSWGALASAAQQTFIFHPYQLFFPALMIGLTMLSFTLLGDGLRDALDPKLRQ